MASSLPSARLVWALAVAVAWAGPASAACPVVSTTADSAGTPPAGSLRECIQLANAAGTPQTITFDPSVFSLASPGTIALVSALPSLTAAGMAVDGMPLGRVIIDGSAVPLGWWALDVGGDNTVIRGLTFAFPPGPISLDGAGDVVEDAEVLNSRAEGVEILDDAPGSRVSRCRIARSERQALIVRQDGSNCAQPTVLESNRIEQAVTRSAIEVVHSSCVAIRDNVISHSPLRGVELGGAGTFGCHVLRNTISYADVGVGVYDGAHDNWVAFNRVHDMWNHGIATGDQGSSGNLIEGNLVVGTDGGMGHGLFLFVGADDAGVFHNTVVRSSGNALYAHNVSGLRAQNNLLVTSTMAAMDLLFAPTRVVEPNLYFDIPAGACNSECAGVDAGDPVNPLFLDAGARDFRVACASPAVDRADNLGTRQMDLTPPGDGLLFFGGAPDFGAFETSCSPDAGPDAGPFPDGGDAPDAGESPDGGTGPAAPSGCACNSGGPALALLAVMALTARATNRRRAAPKKQ